MDLRMTIWNCKGFVELIPVDAFLRICWLFDAYYVKCFQYVCLLKMFSQMKNQMTFWSSSCTKNNLLLKIVVSKIWMNKTDMSYQLGLKIINFLLKRYGLKPDKRCNNHKCWHSRNVHGKAMFWINELMLVFERACACMCILCSYTNGSIYKQSSKQAYPLSLTQTSAGTFLQWKNKHDIIKV